MKWSIVVLIVLGLVAALCAALLTASLSARSGRGIRIATEPQVTVLKAARDIGAMTVLDANAVRATTVAKRLAPAGYCADPVQAVGRVLAMPLSAGQPLTEACFAPAGQGSELAAKLPEGLRAVTISLSPPASLRGLLYPGSVVDVLVAFKVQQGAHVLGEALSTTLLENVQILAVEDRTVGAAPDKQDDKTAKGASSDQFKRYQVTVKVSSRQAEALQLAAEYGSVSLALRNPADRVPVDQAATLLSQGKMAQMADLLHSMVSAKDGAEPEEELVEPEEEEPVAPVAESAPEPQQEPQWQVEVYRGMAHETESIALKK